MTALTDNKAKAMKPGDGKIQDRAVTGLWLMPSKKKKGTGKWFLIFTSPVTGKRRQMALGEYPSTSIASAREHAKAARGLLARKIDPLAARDEQSASSLTRTFEAVARRYHATKRPGWKEGKHIDQWMTSLETYVFPHIGQRLVETLTKLISCPF